MLSNYKGSGSQPQRQYADCILLDYKQECVETKLYTVSRGDCHGLALVIYLSIRTERYLLYHWYLYIRVTYTNQASANKIN